MEAAGSRLQLAGSGSGSCAPLGGFWELQDRDVCRPTRRQQGQQPAAGRLLLAPPRGTCRQHALPSSCEPQARPRFASLTAAALGARGSKWSVDGLQAVPAGVMEGAPPLLCFADSNSLQILIAA